MINFNFVIPLKTLSSLDNGRWNIDIQKAKKVLENLERTLLSICLSRSLFEGRININVFISGHESPFLKEFEMFFQQNYDNLMVKFIENSFERPKEKSEYMQDKERKKNAVFEWMYSNFDFSSANYNILMLFDADDLVSQDFFTKIVPCFSKDIVEDVCLMSGFVFDYKNKLGGYLNGLDRVFYRNCGSSFISLVKKKDFDPDVGFVYKLRNHVKFPEVSEICGRNLKEIYYPIVLYLVNHGQNDVSERYDEKHMVNFVKQYKCNEEKYKLLKDSFKNFIDVTYKTEKAF